MKRNKEKKREREKEITNYMKKNRRSTTRKIHAHADPLNLETNKHTHTQFINTIIF